MLVMLFLFILDKNAVLNISDENYFKIAIPIGISVALTLVIIVIVSSMREIKESRWRKVR